MMNGNQSLFVFILIVQYLTSALRLTGDNIWQYTTTEIEQANGYIPPIARSNDQDGSTIVFNAEGVESIDEDMNFTKLETLYDDLLHTPMRIILENGNLSDVPVKFLKRLPEIKELSLRHNSIRKLRLHEANLTRIYSVDVSHNNIMELVDINFHHSSELTKIVLANNQIRFVPEKMFENQRQLRIIDLSWNDIRFLPADLFANCLQLTHLLLSRNLLETFYPRHLGPLNQLKYLLINNNKLKSFTQSSFNQLVDLQLFNVSHNLLDLWHYNLLDKCVNLVKLDISSNKLLSLNARMFQNSNHLKILVASNGFIRALTGNEFENLKDLESMDISQNKIGLFHLTKLTELRKLKTLDMSHNRLQIHDGIGMFQSLEELNLQDNEKDSFGTLPAFVADTLLKLDLSQNKFRTLESGWLGRMSKLREINLSRNSIETLEDYALDNLKNLIVLDLSYNQLRNLHNTSLEGIPEVQTLYLQGNMLECINTGVFFKMTELRNLHIEVSWSVIDAYTLYPLTIIPGPVEVHLEGDYNRITSLWVFSSARILPGHIYYSTPSSSQDSRIVYKDSIPVIMNERNVDVKKCKGVLPPKWHENNEQSRQFDYWSYSLGNDNDDDWMSLDDAYMSGLSHHYWLGETKTSDDDNHNHAQLLIVPLKRPFINHDSMRYNVSDEQPSSYNSSRGM